MGVTPKSIPINETVMPVGKRLNHVFNDSYASKFQTIGIPSRVMRVTLNLRNHLCEREVGPLLKENSEGLYSPVTLTEPGACSWPKRT